MAEEFVRTEHFEEFSRRIDERFLGLEKQMQQGFAHASKERDHILVHLNQRFDSLEKRFDDQRRIVTVLLTAIVMTMVAGAAAGVGAAVKYVFFS